MKNYHLPVNTEYLEWINGFSVHVSIIRLSQLLILHSVHREDLSWTIWDRLLMLVNSWWIYISAYPIGKCFWLFSKSTTYSSIVFSGSVQSGLLAFFFFFWNHWSNWKTIKVVSWKWAFSTTKKCGPVQSSPHFFVVLNAHFNDTTFTVLQLLQQFQK